MRRVYGQRDSAVLGTTEMKKPSLVVGLLAAFLCAAMGPVVVSVGVSNITGLGTGIATWLGTPSGANLASAVTGALPVKGTATNSSAAAGYVGEYAEAVVSYGSATITITNASPAVVTWTGHPYPINPTGIVSTSVINFTTSGGLPTGLSAGTNYYAVPVDANTLRVASSASNALAGTFIDTSSAGSGTHTGQAYMLLTDGGVADIAGMALTAGDWECGGSIGFIPGAGTAATKYLGWLNTTSNSASVPTSLLRSNVAQALSFTASGVQQFALSRSRVLLASTTNIYMGNSSNFTVSTNTAYGAADCRRMQ